jgi:hypothetical protein
VLLEGAIGNREDEYSGYSGGQHRQHARGHPGLALAHGAASPPRGCVSSPIVVEENRPEIVTKSALMTISVPTCDEPWGMPGGCSKGQPRIPAVHSGLSLIWVMTRTKDVTSIA